MRASLQAVAAEAGRRTRTDQTETDGSTDPDPPIPTDPAVWHATGILGSFECACPARAPLLDKVLEAASVLGPIRCRSERKAGPASARPRRACRLGRRASNSRRNAVARL